MFSLAVKSLGFGDRYPFPRSGAGRGFEILGIVVAVLAVFDGKLHRGGRGVFDGCLEFRIGIRLDPEESANAETRDEDEASDEGAKISQVVLK